MDTKDYWIGMTNLINFYITGFVKLHEEDLDKRDDIPDYLGKKYLSHLFPNWKLVEFTECEKVEVYDRITEWHNDSKFVGCNVTFLYYMDNMSPLVGGSISIRNGIAEEKIYPKNGTLILLSQQNGVEHKAEYCSVRRRMYNIDYFVKGL